MFVGKRMEVKVVKINHANDNVVVSHKILIEKDLEAQRQLILNNLEKGQVLEGVIKNMTNFGAFIDLGGVDGLLHITDISWGRIGHPSDVLSLDQKMNVVVLDFDEAKKRISLGLKQLQAHPWDSLPEGMGVGTKVEGAHRERGRLRRVPRNHSGRGGFDSRVRNVVVAAPAQPAGIP